MNLDTWNNRRLLLEKFQSELLNRFSENDYNVFVFGSYTRKDFNPETSDIDMIVYCPNTLKRMDIAEFCNCFFKNEDLQADVLEYYYLPDAYIYAVGILNSIRLTDYYPKILKNELYIIAKNYNNYLKKQSIKKRYMRWDYIIGKEKRANGKGLKNW